MKFRKSVLLGFVPAVACLALTACGGTEEVTGDRIFQPPPPWGTQQERYVYTVSDRGVDGEGTCEILTRPGIAPNQTQLEERCSKDQFRDEGLVVVDSETLDPVRSERTILDTEKGKRVTHTIAYGDGVAIFSTDDGERQRETERELPAPTEEHPEPGWYDDKSLFWLARGLPLQQGWSGQYAHVINAGQPRVLTVDVRVEALEEVTTGNGTVNAWRIRFERDNTVYFVWVDSESPHTVVRARIESVTYELIEAVVQSR